MGFLTVVRSGEDREIRGKSILRAMGAQERRNGMWNDRIEYPLRSDNVEECFFKAY